MLNKEQKEQDLADLQSFTLEELYEKSKNYTEEYLEIEIDPPSIKITKESEFKDYIGIKEIEYNDIIEYVENGISILIPIYKLINMHFKEFPNHRQVKIIGLGMIDEEDFYKEIELRRRLLQRYLRKILSDEEETITSNVEIG